MLMVLRKLRIGENMTCMHLSVFGKAFDMNVRSLKTSHFTDCVCYTTNRVPCCTDLISHLPHGCLMLWLNSEIAIDTCLIFIHNFRIKQNVSKYLPQYDEMSNKFLSFKIKGHPASWLKKLLLWHGSSVSVLVASLDIFVNIVMPFSV